MSRPPLVLGGTGLLGRATVAALTSRGRPFFAPSRAELDLGDTGAIQAAVVAAAPSAVVNLSGFTDVAAAERPENHAEAWLLNRDVPAVLAAAAAREGVPFVHVSTDYVFDGTKGAPYLEDDPVRPIQVYGETKLAGERRVADAHPAPLILRVSTLFGPGRPQRSAYVDAIVKQAVAYERSSGTLEVVEGPVSSPTYAPDAAEALLDLLDRRATGIVHMVNAGSCSRLALARATVAACYLADRVVVKPKPAPPGGLTRPEYSVLGTGRLISILGHALASWRDALTRYIELLGVGR